MCVAAVIESTPPTLNELIQMEESNPHGAGVAWVVGNVVRFRKGMSAEAIHKIAATLPTPWLLHFRWATHGSKQKYLAHPFPLGRKAFARKLEDSADAVLIHNGTWSGYSKHIPAAFRRADISDTAVAAYVAGRDGEEILDDVSWATAVMRAAGDGRVDITMRGDWETHNGNLYSNLLWQWEGYCRSKSSTGPYLVNGYHSTGSSPPTDYHVGKYGGLYKRIPGEDYVSTRSTSLAPLDNTVTCPDCGADFLFYHSCEVTKQTTTIG